MKFNFDTIKKAGAAALPIILYVGERLVSDKWNEWQTQAMVEEEVEKQLNEKFGGKDNEDNEEPDQ